MEQLKKIFELIIVETEQYEDMLSFTLFPLDWNTSTSRYFFNPTQLAFEVFVSTFMATGLSEEDYLNLFTNFKENY